MMNSTWVSLPDSIKKYIIRMNPSFKEIHMKKMRNPIEEIEIRRRDFSCTGCTRMAIFSYSGVYRRPSVRLFSTLHPQSKTVRVFGECDEHRTTNSMGEVKLLIPRKYDYNKEKMFSFIQKYIDFDNIIMHYGIDENDIMIRLRTLDGTMMSLYQEITRPKWVTIG